MSKQGSLPIYEWEDPDKYELLAWVKASERRVAILTTLADQPMNATAFATEWGVTPEAVRYHLSHLANGGPDGDHAALVRVLTPERRQYKLYGLTEAGAEMVGYL